MCVTFVCTDGLSRGLGYKLLLVNNRDEYLDRPTSAAHWEDGYLAGRDEQAVEKGTWLGITKDGKIGNLLSITEPAEKKLFKPNAPSRGAIASEYLKHKISADDYLAQLHKNEEKYLGFQFLTFEKNENGEYVIKSLVNRYVEEVKPAVWPKGAYVFGNSPPNLCYKKIIHGREVLSRVIAGLNKDSSQNHIVDSLLAIVKDKTRHYPDSQIAIQTGQDDDYNACLSSHYVRFPNSIRYGTRCHTVILIDKNDKVYYREERMKGCPENVDDAEWETTEYSFELEKM